mgnify:CR=1 FL=1
MMCIFIYDIPTRKRWRYNLLKMGWAGPEPADIGGKTMPKVYTRKEIEARLAGHPGWTLADDGQLRADLTFDNFMEAMMFANAVAYLAQAANHHPDLFIHQYKKLSISLMTHSAGGVTDRDFALLDRIDALPRFK